MILKDTVAFMESDKYQDRFIGEYIQLKLRMIALHKVIIKAEANMLDFELKSDLLTLKNQYSYMDGYCTQLEIRALKENITLPVVN